MPIFFSYNHTDREFVDRLAANFVQRRKTVWVDRWELKVGESIIQRVQEAITASSALVIVLSKASVASEWCKKELTAGLLRELEEKRVVVLPALLEDCEVPLFLRDKMYADFRANFDAGLATLLEGVASVTSSTQGRDQQHDWEIDWAIDWLKRDDRLILRLTFVSRDNEHPYSVLTTFEISANEVATAHYEGYAEMGLDEIGRQLIVEGIAEFAEGRQDMFFILNDTLPQTAKFGTRDPNLGVAYDVELTCRRMGEDNGKDVLVNFGGMILDIRCAMRSVLRPLTDAEKAAYADLLKRKYGR